MNSAIEEGYNNKDFERFEEDDDIEAQQSRKISQSMRYGFIRKVYGILAAQLTLTTIFVFIGTLPKIKAYFMTTESSYILIPSMILGIVFMILIMCSKCFPSLKRFNYFFLFGFTLTESIIVMAICSYYPFSIVFSALFLTAGLTLALSLYACKTKTDYTGCGAFLFGILVISILAGFICWFFPFPYMDVIFAALDVILFSIYLIYDTQLIMGQMGIKYDVDDYILAALNVYLDIIRLFISILKILGRKK